MLLLMELSRLLKLITRLVIREMKLKSVVILVRDGTKDRYVVKAGDGLGKDLINMAMSGNYPVFKWLETQRKPLFRDELSQKIMELSSEDKNEKRELEDLRDNLDKAAVYIPGFLKGELRDVICLGGKLSGETFGNEDIELLTTLSNQTTIAIENALLMEKEKEAVRRIAELEVKTQTERLVAVTQMSLGLSHEINNPLTAILANVQFLLKKLEDETEMPRDLLKGRLAVTEKEIKRIRELMHNLQSIAEPVVKELIPGLKVIDVGESIKKAQRSIPPQQRKGEAFFV